MTRVMVRYKVKPDQAARNEELVRAVYEELRVAEPAGPAGDAPEHPIALGAEQGPARADLLLLRLVVFLCFLALFVHGDDDDGGGPLRLLGIIPR